MPFLGLLDTAGIQDFVGRSDRLVLIAKDSDDIASLTRPSGLFDDFEGVERIVGAAGNASYRAEDLKNLRMAIQQMSRTILEQHPGLQLQAWIEPYDKNELAASYGKAMRNLELRKATQPHNTLFTFTGEKSERAKPAPEDEDEDGIFQPRDFDNMICESEEESHLMAVVSVDGLNMGGRLAQWLTRPSRPFDNDDDFVKRFDNWSSTIQFHWEQAWNRARAAVLNAFVPANQLPEDAPSNARSSLSGRVLLHPVMPQRWLALPSHLAEGRSEMRAYYPFRKVYQGG